MTNDAVAVGVQAALADLLVVQGVDPVLQGMTSACSLCLAHTGLQSSLPQTRLQKSASSVADMQQLHGQNELVGVCLQTNDEQNLVYQNVFHLLESS